MWVFPHCVFFHGVIIQIDLSTSFTVCNSHKEPLIKMYILPGYITMQSHTWCSLQKTRKHTPNFIFLSIKCFRQFVQNMLMSIIDMTIIKAIYLIYDNHGWQGGLIAYRFWEDFYHRCYKEQKLFHSTIQLVQTMLCCMSRFLFAVYCIDI